MFIEPWRHVSKCDLIWADVKRLLSEGSADGKIRKSQNLLCSVKQLCGFCAQLQHNHKSNTLHEFHKCTMICFMYFTVFNLCIFIRLLHGVILYFSSTLMFPVWPDFVSTAFNFFTQPVNPMSARHISPMHQSICLVIRIFGTLRNVWEVKNKRGRKSWMKK